MTKRKFFALSLLASLTFMGCADSSSGDDVKTCGNGKIDAGESCDGTLFANGQACPSGTTGTVTCTNECKVDTTACTAITPNPTCNNGTLDANEECDGTLFAAGKNTCPANKTGTVTCSAACTVDTSACVDAVAPATCNNGTLDANEECDGAQFAIGKSTCPEGQTGTVTCSASCTADTSACRTVEVVETCNNGTLDAEEECDGTLFADGKDACPAGTTGTVTCDSTCHAVTSACAPVQPTSTCGDGILDENEECEPADPEDPEDEALFAPEKGVCPAGTSGSVTCTASCKIDTTGCTSKSQEDICREVDGLGVCSSAEEGQAKCDGEKLAFCIEGCWLVEDDCATSGMTCDKDRQACIGKCTNNVFSFGTGNDVLEENCTASAKICDVVNGCVANKNGFTCEGSVLKLTNTEFTYDCKNNKTSDVTADREKLGCNPEVGCSDFYCEGTKLVACVDGQCGGEDLTEDCAAFGDSKVICSNKAQACVCKEDHEFCFMDGEKSKHAICSTDTMLVEECSATCNTTSWCAEEVKTGCGNGTFDAGETCETFQNVTYVKGYKEATCNYYDDKIYVSGAPECPSTCKLDVAKCVEAKDSDYTQVKAYTITSLDDIKALTKSGDATMHGVFGTESKFNEADSGWSLGGWPKTVSFDKSVEFKVGAVNNNAIRITFNARRANVTTSPKSVQVQVLENGTAVYTSKTLTLSDSDKSLQTVTYKYDKAKFENMSFKITAFDAGAGHVIFSDIKVASVKAI